MQNIIYHVDAFSSTLFKGNPAGVYLCDKLPDKSVMQNIAMEMNLSETAFVAPENEHFKIRFYTPEEEIALCGHATLSSSHILFEQNIAKDKIRFNSKVGILEIRKEGELIIMNFPKYNFKQIDIPQSLIESAGFRPEELYKCDHGWFMALLKNEDEVRLAKPDFAGLSRAGFGSLIITAPSSSINYDFVVRCFVPGLGINEDPVTGSAHCALTPFWSDRTGKISFKSLQVSKRTGELFVSLVGDRVEVAGRAITFSRAELIH